MTTVFFKVGISRPIVSISVCFTSAVLPLSSHAWAKEEAGSDNHLPDLFVTASRISELSPFTGPDVRIITGEQIRRSGFSTVSDAIAKLGLVYGAQNLDGSTNKVFDLRGFGSTAINNLVVMIDDVRISENEQAAPRLNSIAVDQIERIEIITGSSTVAYGEGASGGVIRIITRQGGEGRGGSVGLAMGSYNNQEYRANTYLRSGPWSLSAGITQLADGGFRDNSKSLQRNGSFGMGWKQGDFSLGFKALLDGLNNRFPGALSIDEFRSNPRKTNNPDDLGRSSSENYILSATNRWGNWKFSMDVSQRLRRYYSNYMSLGSEVSANSNQQQITPRVSWMGDLLGKQSEALIGLDSGSWTYQSNGVAFDANFLPTTEKATQQSRAVYGSISTLLRDDLRMNLGARRELIRKDKTLDSMDQSDQHRNDLLNASEIGLHYRLLPVFTTFAKWARGYRVANVDENRYSVVNAMQSALLPQTSLTKELGVRYEQGSLNSTLKVFEQNTRNEINYDAFNFVNINVDPTQRKGIEWDMTQQSGAWTAGAAIALLNAEFKEGDNAGKQIPQVPKRKLNTRLEYAFNDVQRVQWYLNAASNQVLTNDFANVNPNRISGYAVSDIRYLHKLAGVQMVASVNNVTNRKYFTTAVSSATSSAFNVYPDLGRTFKVSGLYEF